MKGLQLLEVHFAYEPGSPVLQGASMGLGAGEVVALVGPNGSGKTTLLRMAAGLLRPDRGQCQLDSIDLDRMGAQDRAREIVYLPQEVRPLYDFEVGQVVELARYPHRPHWAARPSSEDRAAVQWAMDECDVTHLEDRIFPSLSGGEKQRVLLAAALAQGGRILVLDEPTTALDPHHQCGILNRLRAAAAGGKAVLFSTHDLNLAATFADRIVLLDGGTVAREGRPSEVLEIGLLERVFGPGLVVGSHGDGRPWVLPTAELPSAPGREQ